MLFHGYTTLAQGDNVCIVQDWKREQEVTHLPGNPNFSSEALRLEKPYSKLQCMLRMSLP